jgi:large subunit ribosomal protein L25
MIPAVLYREGESQPIKLSKKELSMLINTSSSEQVMVDLQFEDGAKKIALLKDYQLDPVKGELLHSDFFEVSLTEEVKITIHIQTTGEAVGVKRDGGILQHTLRDVEIECLPDRIPGQIEVDVSELEIGQSIHVSDLQFGEGIKVITEPGEVIATVIAPVIEEVAPPAEEAIPEEAAEPEVVKKGKKEEEGEGEKTESAEAEDKKES